MYYKEAVYETAMYSDDSKKVPPVPMPNTVVKLLSAEDSLGLTYVKAGRRYAFRRFSSVGRASALQAEGHRFKSYNLHFYI